MQRSPRDGDSVPAESWVADARLLADAIREGTGPVAIALLSTIDPGHLDARDRVRYLQSWAAQEGWVAAERAAAVVAVAGGEPRPSGASTGDPRVVDEESVVAEVACALRISERTAEHHIATARALCGPLLPAVPALRSGAWGFGHLRVAESELVPLLVGVPDDAARQARAELVAAVLDDVLPHAATDTPSRLRRRIRSTVARLDADALAQRCRAAESNRGLHLEPMPDLQGRITVDGPWAHVAWIHRVVDAWARRQRDHRCDQAAAGDAAQHQPSLAALRVDGLTEAARLLAVALGLRETGEPHDAATVSATAAALVSSGRAVVAPDTPGQRRRSWAEAVVVVPVDTALGLRDEPGFVPGYGAVPAAIARELLASAQQWRRFLTDDAGRLLDSGSARYRPSARLRELVTARDQSCAFPGCSLPAAEADLDHVATFDGGNTVAANLQPLCRRHHRLKTHGPWRVTDDVDPPQWRSPAGLVHDGGSDPLWTVAPPIARVHTWRPTVTVAVSADAWPHAA